MKRIMLPIAITVALLSFVFGQAQQEATNNKSEQEVRQIIEKYRAALLQRDLRTLQKIWADDYVFVIASGQVMTKPERIANLNFGLNTHYLCKEDEKLTVL